jgi:hypothetical protein
MSPEGAGAGMPASELPRVRVASLRLLPLSIVLTRLQYAALVHGVVAALLVIFPLIGLAARRWLAVLLPAFGWPLYYLGLNRGWWGYGTGDGWQFVGAGLTAVGIIATALAVAVARFLHLAFGVPRPMA